jgi:hypothetical protein
VKPQANRKLQPQCRTHRIGRFAVCIDWLSIPERTVKRPDDQYRAAAQTGGSSASSPQGLESAAMPDKDRNMPQASASVSRP